MKFLVPNYSCVQNPWLGVYRPQIPVLSVLCPQLNLLNPPPNKIPGYATGHRPWGHICRVTLIAATLLRHLQAVHCSLADAKKCGWAQESGPWKGIGLLKRADRIRRLHYRIMCAAVTSTCWLTAGFTVWEQPGSRTHNLCWEWMNIW